MTSIDSHIFRAYDIRGRAGTQLTEEACRLIGYAFGLTVQELYQKKRPVILLGRDARLSSPAFEKEVMEGLLSAGCEVLLMGQTPSPLNYFTICDRALDGGVQITASHNPGHDNGIKLQVREAEAFSGDELQKLYKRIIQLTSVPAGTGADRAIKTIDAVTPYTEHLEEMFHGAGAGLSVVIDGGNGVAGPLYSKAVGSIGCTVDGLYLEPDGNFPNHPADPSKWETLKDLQKRVKQTKADIGLAFDGDGDRLGIVDETGTVRSADDILLLLSKDLLEENPGATVVFTVSNSASLESEIRKWGGNPVMCKVGHSFVEHAMREHQALLGGEQSGHFFCAQDYYGFDDALVAALRILAILKKSGKTLSMLCSEFPKVFQAPERRPHCPDDRKADVVERIADHFAELYPVNTLDGVRIDFGEGAWAGIRKSNTSPCLSVCLEARSQQALVQMETEVLSHLSTYPEVELEV
ncbi:phosphomannomutase/phosphoglucomutase [Candidatus Peregrinibacteria bacterium]|nr:phosphomannomutase/phosphoglucomutase [Candidatus Peregrinibacteria bacterium]